MKDLTIIINSCDKHSAAWQPFFTLFWNMWKNVDCPIVLNTESKKYNDKRVECFNTSINLSWSKRLYECLKHISTDYVLIFLEDFFLEREVKEKQILKAYNYMKQNKKIACISFMNSPDGIEESDELKGFSKLNKKARYRVSCQVGMWNRKNLMRIIRKHESAWEFEVLGTKRSRRYPYEFFSIMKGEDFPFDYSWGKPIYRGHWNLEAVKQTEERGEIKINTIDLPCINNMKELPQQKKRKKNLKNLIRRIRSI